MRPTEPFDTQVLVVGAGPAGLAIALELGLRGITATVVEQQARAGVQPRAKTTNVRSMQHMRRWGVAQALRDASPLPPTYPTDVVFATTLLGRTLAVIENAFEGAKRRDERFPEPAQWVPQYTVEAVLRARLATLQNVSVFFGTAFEGAMQSSSDVTATVGDLSGKSRTVRAQFLIGADGARSRVRETIGAHMQGDHAFAFNYNLIVRIPELERCPPARQAIMYWLINPDSAGVMGPLDRGGLWYFNTALPPGVRDISDKEIIRRVRAAVGRSIEVEIVTRDTWAAHRLVADGYRDRRIFLVGDACHLHPPFGGYGMNLGVADGVDLGWKLAAVLQNWGGEGLLDSYEAERRPVHLRTIAEAVENYRVLSSHLNKDGLDDDGREGDQARAEVAREIVASKTREFATLGVVLGSRYRASPIIVDDGSLPPVEHHTNFEPSAHPGCLAPHAWLADGTSLYDHFGSGYTLLRLGGAAAEQAAAIEAAAIAAGVPLKVLELKAEQLRDIYQAPLTLIRPDQHVGWRGTHADADALIAILRGADTVNQQAEMAS